MEVWSSDLSNDEKNDIKVFFTFNTWNGMNITIQGYVKNCHKYQLKKQHKQEHGKYLEAYD